MRDILEGLALTGAFYGATIEDRKEWRGALEWAVDSAEERALRRLRSAFFYKRTLREIEGAVEIVDDILAGGDVLERHPIEAARAFRTLITVADAAMKEVTK